MTSHRWAAATDIYNWALACQNAAQGLPVVKKKPHALMEKLGDIEPKIIERIQAGNYKCTYSRFKLIAMATNF